MMLNLLRCHHRLGESSALRFVAIIVVVRVQAFRQQCRNSGSLLIVKFQS
jgi:hypothetical protein